MIHRRGKYYIYSCRSCGVVCKNEEEPLKIDGQEMCGECWFKLYDPQPDPTS